METSRRQTAIKVRISDLLNGEFVKKSGWEPSYVVTTLGNASRVNIIGYVVSADENSFMIDDSTGNIPVRIFEENLRKPEVGSLVLLIGRPRQFNEELYVAPEIIRLLEDKSWFELRRLELTGEPAPQQKSETVPAAAITDESPYEHVLNIIKSLDQGSGADYDAVLQAAKVKKPESVIHNLLEEGEVYEIRKGKLKVLD
jgi:hypothetical protein